MIILYTHGIVNNNIDIPPNVFRGKKKHTHTHNLNVYIYIYERVKVIF